MLRNESGSGVPRVVIEREEVDGEMWWVVYDHTDEEPDEFARASTIELALPYVRALLYGPGTGPPREFVDPLLGRSPFGA